MRTTRRHTEFEAGNGKLYAKVHARRVLPDVVLCALGLAFLNDTGRCSAPVCPSAERMLSP